MEKQEKWGIYHGMQTISENNNKKSYSRRADSMDSVIYAKRVSRCVKREYTRRFGGRRSGI